MLPTFMPVATQAAIKGLTAQQMESLGVTLILNNTYHLNLRPGIKILNEAGGAHKFQGWNRNLLTVIHKPLFRAIRLSLVGQWWFSTRFPQQIYDDHRGRCTLPGPLYR
jgi:tRNA-guanine family transglycosylase